MARTPNALVHALDGVMENSALAMVEQQHGRRLVNRARQHERRVLRAAVADGVIDTEEQELIREARCITRGCEIALTLDVQDEEQLREPAGTLDAYITEQTRHKRHEPPTEAARTRTVTA